MKKRYIKTLKTFNEKFKFIADWDNSLLAQADPN